MDSNHLIRMCNQIGQFFESMPNREEALEDYANHLKKFWAPIMRQQLLAEAQQEGDANLSPIAVDMLGKYRELLQ